MLPPSLVKLLLLLVPSLGVLALAWRLPERRLHLLLAVASTAVGLLLAEAGLRLWAPQVNQHDELFEADPELGWRMRAGARATVVQAGGIHQQVRSNTWGFRDREWTPTPGRGLLVLGDSFSSNLAVADEAVFTEVLEGHLGGEEVYNLGVNGFGTLQEALLLDRHLEALSPRAVLVVVYLQNDLPDNIDAPWLFGRPVLRPQAGGFVVQPPGADPPPRTARWHPRRLSHLWALVDRTVERGLAHLRTDEPGPWRPPELELCQREPSPESVLAFDAFGHALGRIQARTEAAGLPLGVVLAPSDVLVDPTLWEEMLQTWGVPQGALDRQALARRTAEEAAALGLPVLDLSSALGEARDRGLPLYHPAERHWTVEGNAVVAEAIAAWLAEEPWS